MTWQFAAETRHLNGALEEIHHDETAPSDPLLIR
jgi:hypothetical protein